MIRGKKYFSFAKVYTHKKFFIGNLQKFVLTKLKDLANFSPRKVYIRKSFTPKPVPKKN